jgi:CubicO group peptidase (beta-lactamase class C family)
MHRIFAALATGLLLTSPALAQQDGRPEGLTLGNFQYPPYNRWAFSHVREVITTANIPHDNRRILTLEKSPDAGRDFSFQFQGKLRRLDEIAAEQYIDGILVIRDGRILVEKYYGALRPELPHLMMSVNKSVLGLLAGKLAEQGRIDLSRSVAHYVPALAASGWGPDSLQTLMDMRDGADYTEDYEDMHSTVRLQDCALGWSDADYCPEDGPQGGYEFFASVGRNEDKLGKFIYKSGSTDVIGWVLEEATGKPLATLISEYIWQPMGAEFDANITIDSAGFALGDGGMSATLRDLGRFGLLVLNDGHAQGTQVVPTAFIRDIENRPPDPEWPYPVNPDKRKPYYRSFWWGVGNGEGDIEGLGINGQFVHVAPGAGMVIAIFSSWPRADVDEGVYGWAATYDLGEALIRKFRK